MKAATFTKALPALAEVPFDIPHVQNLVVGAGPAGYAVVSTLLDAGSQPIAWVDPEFRSGRLASYLDVPSNTKVKLFEKFATTPSCMSKGAETAVEDFKTKDPEKGCQLAAAQSMVVKLSESLHQHHADQVKARRGVISSLALNSGIWDINQGLLTADRVFLATGSHPRDDQLYPGLTNVPLDDALIPSKLSGQVTPADTVCVVGSSHSAILVLMNLLELKNGPRVVNLYRSSLKYAKFRDDGTISLDNTGLKGTAADWAREKVDSGQLERTGKLRRIDTTKHDPAEALKACTKLVIAVGFERNALPKITVDGKQLQCIQHDKHTGSILPDKLFGFGIAFPEEVTDAEFGHKEANVGLWKFMRFARRVLQS